MKPYSKIQISIHWLSAIAVIGLFILGLWMVDLDYYSPYYQTAPDWHRSVGILLMILTLVRILVKVARGKVEAVSAHKTWEKVMAKIAHWVMYLCLFGLFISGYLISTADGEAIQVFNWFEVPALFEFEDSSDLAGVVHEIVAYSLIGLVVVHALGALKHHFIDKDETLKRMLGLSKS